MKRFLLAIFGLGLLFCSVAKAQFPSDGFVVDVNGGISVIKVQADGKIIIGGSFTQVNGVNRNYLARLNVNRTVDSTFNPNPNFFVSAILIQPTDGKILVGGSFSQIGGASQAGIARLNSDGTLDSQFADEDVAGFVYAIALDLNGHILIGGAFDFIASTTRNNMARLDKDTGELDFTFNPNIGSNLSEVRAIAVQTNGQIIIGGKFSSVGGLARNGLARINPTTGIADPLNPYSLFSVINSIAIQPNGKILVAGELIGGFVSKKVARIDDVTGIEDSSFSATFSGTNENPGQVVSIALQPNGKILVGGGFFTVNGQPRLNIVRLNTNGSLDSGFAVTNPNNAVLSVAIQSSGKILIGGNFTTVFGGVMTETRNRLAALETDGRLDKNFDLSILGGGVRIIVPQPDGKIIIAGTFTFVMGFYRNHIARINADGSLDTAFDPNQAGQMLRIFAVALDSMGRVYVGGEFLLIGGQLREGLARLDPITGHADSFNVSSSFVVSIYVDSNDNVLVSGGFSSYCVRLDSVTGNSDSFCPDPNDEIEAFAEQTDGKVLLAGNFTTLTPDGGTPETHNRIARVNTDGTIDNTFNPDINSRVEAMKLQPDGKILVGGNFTQVNGVNRNYIARLNADGTLDTAFNPNSDSGITSINVQSNGKILVTGFFTNIGGLPRNGVARLNEITGVPELVGGTLDAYDPNVNGVVYASAIQADGKVLIGGDFSNVGGVSRSNFARLTNDTYAVSEMTITQTAISWQVDGSTPQFNRVRFELSTNGGQTFTFLGNGTPSLSSAKNETVSPNSPQANTFNLTGLNLPTGQEILIRATGSSNGSAVSNEKLQSAFLLAPTAANVSVSGRVLTANGRGFSNAVVSLTDGQGITRTTRTSSFGYYRFDEIVAGQTIVMNVRSKQFQFEPRVLSIGEDLTDVDFMPIGESFKE